MISPASGPPHGVTPRPVAACGATCPAGLGRAGEPCVDDAGHVELDGATPSPHMVPANREQLGVTWRDLAPAEVREQASAYLVHRPHPPGTFGPGDYGPDSFPGSDF